MYQQTKRALDRLKQSGIAERVVMPGEDPEQFYQLCDDLLLELTPRGRLQEEYVRRIAELLWKKQQLRMKLADEAKHDPRSQKVIDLEKAIALYGRNKAAEEATNGKPTRPDSKSELEEESEEYQESRRSGSDLEPGRLNPEMLRHYRRMMSALDDQISDAMKRLIELKRMQNQLELAR